MAQGRRQSRRFLWLFNDIIEVKFTVQEKRFTLGIVRDLTAQGYKWTRASDDRNKIKDIAQDYEDAVVVHNPTTGLSTLYTRGYKLPVSKVGKYRVADVEHVGEEVKVRTLEGESIRFKDITCYPIGEKPPEEKIVEAAKEEPTLSTSTVEVGKIPLEYQAAIPGLGSGQAEFAGLPAEKKDEKKPAVEKPEYFYTTLEAPGKPVGKEEELKPKKEKPEEERPETDLGEFAAWVVLAGGGAIGFLKALDHRSGMQQQQGG